MNILLFILLKINSKFVKIPLVNDTVRYELKSSKIEPKWTVYQFFSFFFF